MFTHLNALALETCNYMGGATNYVKIEFGGGTGSCFGSLGIGKVLTIGQVDLVNNIAYCYWADIP